MSCDVAIIISDLTAGGAQRVASNLAKLWNANGRQVVLITLSSKDQDVFKLPSSIRRIVLGGVKDSRSLISAFIANLHRIYSLRKALNSCHAPVAISFIGSMNILTVLASIGLPVRIIISERNDPAKQSLGYIWNTLRRWTYGHADIVTSNSYGAIRTLSSFVNSEKIMYAPNPVIVPSSLPERKPESIILTVGRLEKQKAHDILIPAFAKTIKDISGWKLVIVGVGPLENTLRKQVRDLDIEDYVDFIGTTDPWKWYMRASVFALPSRFEGMPNALLEAMAAGIAPIVSDSSGGALEIIDHEKNGLVIKAEDSDDLAKALSRLMINHKLRNQLGFAAASKSSTFNASETTKKWNAILGFDPPKA